MKIRSWRWTRRGVRSPCSEVCLYRLKQYKECSKSQVHDEIIHHSSHPSFTDAMPSVTCPVPEVVQLEQIKEDFTRVALVPVMTIDPLSTPSKIPRCRR